MHSEAPMKRTFYSEFAYVLGMLFLPFGTALMEKAGFGMSMVVAPAYILHLKISQHLPFFSLGMAEYCLQLVLIVFLSAVLRKFKKGYLFSFLTAVLYGFVLDFFISLLSFVGADSFAARCVFFVSGMLCGSIGVAFFFKTYFAPEAYELVVRELSLSGLGSITVVKTSYDMISLSVSVIMSFCFFGFLHFEGVRLGTLITALVNGWIIGHISAFLDSHFCFSDKFPLRKIFEA